MPPIRYFYFVRAIRFILALYILLISVYPCGDGDPCLDEQQAEIGVFDTASHDNEDGDQNLCTPFCNCTCCAAQVQLTDIAFISFDYTHNTELKPPYLLTSVVSGGTSIWQPPRA